MKRIVSISLLLFLCLGCYGLTDTDDSDLISVVSIASLRDVNCNYNSVLITENWVLEGVVTANDEYGEFYNCIIVEDNSAALKIMCEMEDNHKLYPIGSAVQINCSGLYLSNLYGLIVIGDQPDSDYTITSISQARVGQYLKVVDSCSDQPLLPQSTTIDALTPLDSYRFMLFSNVRISNEDGITTFCSRNPDTGFTQATSHTITDRSGNTMKLYVNRLCTYADAPLPEGECIICAIIDYYDGSYSATITNWSYVEE